MPSWHVYKQVYILYVNIVGVIEFNVCREVVVCDAHRYIAVMVSDVLRFDCPECNVTC